MANYEALEAQASVKLNRPYRERAERGIFLMPVLAVAEWYKKSDVQSMFRGQHVGGVAELVVTVARGHSYNCINVRLLLPLNGPEDAHVLNFSRGRDPRLISNVRKLGFGIRKIDKRIPSEADIEAFSEFLRLADDYNVLLPLNEFSTRQGFSFSRMDSGIVLPAATSLEQSSI